MQFVSTSVIHVGRERFEVIEKVYAGLLKFKRGVGAHPPASTSPVNWDRE